jgi:hypothetical protein
VTDAKKKLRKPPSLPFPRIASLSCVIKLPPSSIHLLHETDTDDDDDGVRWMIIGKHCHGPGNISTPSPVLVLFVLVCLGYINVPVLGGFDGLTQLSSCISYVPSLNKWLDMPTLNVGRYHSSISIWKGVRNDFSIHFTLIRRSSLFSFLNQANILLSLPQMI